MCDREFLRSAAEVYFENEYCVYAMKRLAPDGYFLS